MDISITKKLSEELNQILEDYSFLKLGNEVILFWCMKECKEKDIINNEEYTQDDVIDTFLEHNDITIDSHCYISNNGISFEDCVNWNLENIK
jgi:hypothetical protein